MQPLCTCTCSSLYYMYMYLPVIIDCSLHWLLSLVRDAFFTVGGITIPPNTLGTDDDEPSRFVNTDIKFWHTCTCTVHTCNTFVHP